MPYQSMESQRSLSVGVRRSIRPVFFSERILDAIPGGLAWLGMGVVILGAYTIPAAIVGAAALLATYSALRFTLAAVAFLWGLRLTRRWEAVDWLAKYDRRAAGDSIPLNRVHHVVIIPNYKEPLDLLRRTLGQLAKQSGAASAMSVILAMEAREPEATAKSASLRAEYGALFKNFFVAYHPRGLSGEIQCKSSNEAWAARWARRVLVEDLGYNPNDLVVTTMDADTIWHPHYFECLGVLFAIDPHRYATYWQAPIRYHGNVWAIHPLMRLLHACSSAWELAYLAAPWWHPLPMSSYSMSMHLLDSVGYWDPDAIADEWHMYIKSYFQRRGDIHLQPVFLPFWANATAGNGLVQAIKERYLQTLRHAWGAKEIGYTIAQMDENPQVPLGRGFRLLLCVAHDNLLAGVGWIIMTLGSQVPLLLHPELLNQPAFLLLQIAFTMIPLLTTLVWVLDWHIRPPRPSTWRLKDGLYELISLPLLAIMTLICVALPVLHAQSRLMLGKPIRFRVSAKM